MVSRTKLVAGIQHKYMNEGFSPDGGSISRISRKLQILPTSEERNVFRKSFFFHASMHSGSKIFMSVLDTFMRGVMIVGVNFSYMVEKVRFSNQLKSTISNKSIVKGNKTNKRGGGGGERVDSRV